MTDTNTLDAAVSALARERLARSLESRGMRADAADTIALNATVSVTAEGGAIIDVGGERASSADVQSVAALADRLSGADVRRGDDAANDAARAAGRAAAAAQKATAAQTALALR